MENTFEKLLIIIGNEININGNLKEHNIPKRIKAKKIKLEFVEEFDFEEKMQEILENNPTLPYAILVHANATDQDYKTKLLFKINDIREKTQYDNFFILSGIDRVKLSYESEPVLNYLDLYKSLGKEFWKYPNLFTTRSGLTPNQVEQYDYLFITALFDQEFEYIKEFCVFENIKENQNQHYIGHLEFAPSKKVIAIHQLETGMVDAAILTAEMIARYKPKNVIMTGVCGGNPIEGSLNIGDIIIPDHIYLFEKGKKTEENKTEVYLKELVTTKTNGGHIAAITNVKSSILKKVKEYTATIDDRDIPDGFVSNKLKIHIAKPMACSFSVINVEGFFAEVILPNDRDTIGVEMESYAVARACELSDLQPKCLIIKSVMDKTQFKTDNGKRLAGRTSAKCLEELLRAGVV